MVQGVFAAQLLLGCIFLMSATGKLIAPRRFISNVLQYNILPIPLAKAYGWSVPVLELSVATLLFVGVWVQLAAGIAVIMLISFVSAVSLAVVRGQSLSCSCFGLLYEERIGWPTITRDMILLALAGFLLFAGGRALSIAALLSLFPSYSSILALTLWALTLSVAAGIGWVTLKPAMRRQRGSRT